MVTSIVLIFLGATIVIAPHCTEAFGNVIIAQTATPLQSPISPASCKRNSHSPLFVSNFRTGKLRPASPCLPSPNCFCCPQFRWNRFNVRTVLSSYSSNDDGDNSSPQDAEIVGKEGGSGGSGSSTTTTMSLLERIDQAGLKLKPMAMNAKEKSQTVTHDRWKGFVYTLKACALFTLFIFYRAYRGFFVIIPAVFREVYRKMEKAVDSPFVDDDDARVVLDELELTDEQRDVNPKTGRVRLRTRITVSILAGIVTITYVISGAFRVLGKFLGTITRTSSVNSSFEAAADEVIVNESKILNMTKKMKINGEK